MDLRPRPRPRTAAELAAHVGGTIVGNPGVTIAAQTGISGSAFIEDDVMIGGQTAIGEHATFQRGAMIGGGSAVFPWKIIRRGQWAGHPVQPLRAYKRLTVASKRMPKTRENLRDLERRVRSLESGPTKGRKI